MKKVAIYTRISTTEQSETVNKNTSTDTQEQFCRNYIKGKDMKVYKVYSDNKSARDLNRPALQQLISDSEDSKFDVLLVARIDRISRNLIDFNNLIDSFEELGVEVIIVNENFDTSTPMGKMARNMLAVFAEFESDMNSKRVKEQRANSIKNGTWMGGLIPLGYDRSEDGILKVNEKEADLVNYIFDLYLKHKSVPIIKDILNKEGFRNKKWLTKKGIYRGGGKFNTNSLYSILKRTLYTGKLEHEGKLYDGQHDGIITQEKFKSVSKIINENNKNAKSYTLGNSPNLLESIIDCGLCNHSMTPTHTQKPNKRYYYYICVKKNKEGKSENHNPKDLPQEAVDNFALNTLKLFRDHSDMVTAFKKRMDFNIDEKIEELTNHNKQLNLNRTNILNKIDSIQETALNNTDSMELWNNKLAELTNDKAEIEQEINKTNEALEKLKDSEVIDESRYSDILSEFFNHLKNSELNEKKEMIQNLIKSVESSISLKNKKASGELLINYTCDEKLYAEWQEIKKCATNKEKSLSVRTSFGVSSPQVADLRILFSIKWPLRALNRGPKGYRFEIDWEKLLEIYPFLNHANLCKPRFSVNQKQAKKKKLSPAEQAKVYRKLLNSGKVKNKAAIARKFGVSRAWVTKLLN